MTISLFRVPNPYILPCLTYLICAGALAAQTQNPWVSRTSGTADSLNGIAFGAGVYSVVGDGGVILTSPDAETWAPSSSGTTAALRAVCFGASQFVAVGGSGIILTSPDGIAWTRRTSSTTSFLSGVTYGGGKYLAVGAFGTAVTSADGVTWFGVDSTAGGNFLQGVIFGNGRFLAYGQEGVLQDGELHGTLRTSEDGTEWTTVTMPVSSDVYAATFFRGRYYTGGIYGECFSSADLLLWRQENPGASSSIRAMSTDGYTLVAVGQDGGIHASTNGVAWTNPLPAGDSALHGLGFANGQFVAVGDEGTILTSAQDPIVTAYDAWKKLRFTQAEQADPDISGSTVDAEHDGLANIVEFAHGLDPKVADSDSERLLRLRYSDTFPRAELRWTFDQTATESVSIALRYSDTLAPGSWQALPVPPEVLDSDGDLQSVISVDEMPSDTRRFYRLEYTLME